MTALDVDGVDFLPVPGATWLGPSAADIVLDGIEAALS